MLITIIFFAALLSLVFSIPTMIHWGVHSLEDNTEFITPIASVLLWTGFYYLTHK